VVQNERFVRRTPKVIRAAERDGDQDSARSFSLTRSFDKYDDEQNHALLSSFNLKTEISHTLVGIKIHM
jgi:hypothetical protein